MQKSISHTHYLPKGTNLFPNGPKRRIYMKNLRLPHNHGSSTETASFHKALADNEKFASSSEVFKTLSDATRIRMFWILCHKEECVINLSYLLDISSPAVSHHLRLLKEAKLVEGRRDGKEVYYKAADSELCRLLHLTTEQLMDIACPENESSISNIHTIHSVHDFLTENLSKRITIDELSKKFHINPTTLKKTFKEEYKMSVAAHMKEHRMEKAAELLNKTSKSIGQISKEVGYESQSKFTTAFKSIYNMSPLEYKKQKR